MLIAYLKLALFPISCSIRSLLRPFLDLFLNEAIGQGILARATAAALLSLTAGTALLPRLPLTTHSRVI